MELLSAGRLILLVLSVSQDHIKLKQNWRHWLCVHMLRIFVHWAVSNLHTLLNQGLCQTTKNIISVQLSKYHLQFILD